MASQPSKQTAHQSASPSTSLSQPACPMAKWWVFQGDWVLACHYGSRLCDRQQPLAIITAAIAHSWSNTRQRLHLVAQLAKGGEREGLGHQAAS